MVILMLEHFGSSAVMSQCVLLASDLSVRSCRQCTLMSSCNLFGWSIESLSECRGLLRKKINVEPEAGLDLYLGCTQSKGSVVLGDGHKVTTATCCYAWYP